MTKEGSGSYLWLMRALGVGRAPFLSLSLVTVGFAWSLALFQTGMPSFIDTLLILLAMISSHVGVNALNEYQDFKSGLDEVTQRTPFSGGSGTLVEAPEFAESTRVIAIVAIGLAGLIGLWFVSTVGIELLPVGVLGLWIVINYTAKINKHPWLCLVSPGVGIGVLATLGSVYILSGQLSFLSVVLVLGYACLLNNLLLLNQYPDKKADAEFDRSHLWIRYGAVFSLAVYRAQWLLAFLIVIFVMAVGYLPWFAVFILAGPLTLYPLLKYTKTQQSLDEHLIACLGKNVMLCHFYPIALSFILIFSWILA